MNLNELIELPAKILREELKKRVVRFTYLKKDGTKRQAIGTRNLALAEERLGETIPAPKGEYENENAYYDLEAKGWRSFVPINIISLDD